MTRKNNVLNREKLQEELIFDEGVKYEVYLDHLGYPTFGIGHLLKETDPEYAMWKALPEGGVLQVTEERVNEAFKEDTDCAIGDCQKLFRNFDTFSDDLKRIIINMMFNLGLTRLSKFKNFITCVNNKHYITAGAEMKDSLWYKQVTKRADRLISRMIKIK